MLRLKYLLTAILLMVAYVANAQTIQVYKDGAVVKEYSSAEVDSVVYKPAAAQPRYYYYAGWTKPDSEAKLAELANGYENSIELINHDYTLAENQIHGGDDQHYYVIVPENVYIWDIFGNNISTSMFNNVSETITGYKTYISKGTFDYIRTIKIHK